MLRPTGFWSYTTSDDTSSRGKLSQLRSLLAAELQQQIGRDPKVNIFQDVVAIPPGGEWDHQIRAAINEASFIIPIVTPGFLQSEWCCREVALFQEREERIGVRSLVFPLHYVDTDHVDGTDVRQCNDADVLTFLRTRQWTDFRALRLKSIDNEDVSIVLETLAKGILKALREAGLEQQRAETRRRQAEAEAARLADEQRRVEEEQAARLARQQARMEEAERLAKDAQARKDAEAAQIAEAKRRKEEARAAGLAEKRRRQDEIDVARQAGDRAKRRVSPAMVAIVLAVGVAGLTAIGLSRSPRPAAPAAAPATITTDLERAAAGGSAAVMIKLGNLYYAGQGVPQDYGKAREWYVKAAAAGGAAAMYGVGFLYYNGQGVPQDYAKAREWYEKGAAAGSANAMVAEGNLYSFGRGVAQDYAAAREWYLKAAFLNSSTAMYNLGTLYENGQGVSQDRAKAVDWYTRGAEGGSVNAMVRLSFIYSTGLGMPKDQAEADRWKGKSEAASKL